MRKRATRKLGLLSWILLPLTAVLGCPTLPAAIPCGTIPEGGCPLGRGGTCDDTSCRGLYDCVDGVWVSAEVCAGNDGGVPDGGPSDGGPCTPITVDRSGEQTNCTPDLQSPDCPIEVALPCAETACSTGCSDFYLCTSAGWTAVAYCDDENGFIASP
jgi:hypothetical protein